MAININSASVKELTTLPGIGVKFAQIIVSKREELGTISTDTFHDNPSLQTKLNELAEKGLIISHKATAQLQSSSPCYDSTNTTPW